MAGRCGRITHPSCEVHGPLRPRRAERVHILPLVRGERAAAQTPGGPESQADLQAGARKGWDLAQFRRGSGGPSPDGEDGVIGQAQQSPERLACGRSLAGAGRRGSTALGRNTRLCANKLQEISSASLGGEDSSVAASAPGGQTNQSGAGSSQTEPSLLKEGLLKQTWPELADGPKL